MAAKDTSRFFISFVILHLYIHVSLSLLIQHNSVPHTAKVGHNVANVLYWGQKFSLENDPQFRNISKFFSTLSDGRIITISDISSLLGKKISLVVNNQLGSQSWQDVFHLEVKNGHSMLSFPTKIYEGHVLENLPPKAVVEGLEDLFVKTKDNAQKQVLFTIVSGPKELFKLIQHSDNTLSIVTLKRLDREQKDSYHLKIKAWTDLPYLEYTHTDVTIFVDDENDNIPHFEKSSYYTTISDDLPALSTVFFVQASDPDVGKLKYTCETCGKIFAIDPDRGHVILKSTENLMAPFYDLRIFATDPDGQRSNATLLHISVDGVLRFSPYSSSHIRHKRDAQPAKEVEIPESYVGDLLDIVNNAYDRFRLKEPAPEMLEINFLSGTVRLRDGYKLDYETQPEIEFTVIITQTNDNLYRQEQKVRIKLTDVNDEFPEFINQPRPFLATVSQNAGPGTSVYQLMARDDDQQSDIEYGLESGGEDRFVVDKNTGIVRTKGNRQFKYGKEYEIGVSATDASAVQQQQKSPTHSLKILVGSRAPQFFEPLYEAEVSENAEPGHEIVHIMAYSFQGFPVTYELTTSAGLSQNNFAIKRETGVVDLLNKLDYETNPTQYHLKVKAIEAGQMKRTSTVNLIISLVDENDNSPNFPLSQYIVKGIAETVAVGAPIIVVTATDLDSVTNAQLTYSVTDSNFTVHSANNIGYIKTARRLDYDYIPDHTYNFTVIATDNGSPPRNGSATVRVGVTNVNDESPVFAQTIEHVQVSEDAYNTMVHVVQAYDPDGDDVAYTFLDGNMEEDPFRIDPKSGIISLYGQLDRRRTSYKLNITSTDNGMCCGGTTSRTSRGQVVVEIKDINNNAPVFPQCSSYAPQVDERRSAGTFVLKVSASDPDRGANGNVSYSVVKSGDQSSEYFSVDRITGNVRTADIFDRESKTGVTDLGLTIKAEDQGSPSLAGFCTFRVKIGDVNDNPPVFDLPKYSTSTEESSIIGKKVLQVYATDRDAGENGQVEYSISTDPSHGFFRIEQYTGWIKVARAMSGHSHVTLRVRAQDKGRPIKFSEVEVHIKITQTVNAYPQWVEDYSLQPIMLSENAPRDYIVKRLKAVSTVEDSPFVNYVIQAGETPDQNGPPESFHSRIDEATNEMLLMVYKSLDYEIINTFTLNIKAANRATNSIHNDTRLTIKLIDENDEIPMFVGLDENGRYSGTVPENSPPGTNVIRVTATDRDAQSDYNKVTYRLKHIYDFEKFTVDRQTGQVSTTDVFDREVKSEYYIMVVAEDSAKSDRPNHYPPGTPNQGEVEVQIRITDMNDERPYFKHRLYTASVPENADPGSVIITVTAEDKDEENTLTYSITHGNIGNAFEVNSALGKVMVRGSLDYEKGPKQYRLTYRVFDDKYDNTTTVIIHVTDVNDNPPMFQSAVYNFTDLVEEEEGISKGSPKYLLTVRAVDPDTDRDSNIRYSLNGQFSKDGTFMIDEYSGEIYLTRALDRDKPKGRPVWNFNVLAHDEPGTDSSMTGYAEVRVMPHDINDNNPEFSENFLIGRVTEHSRQGFSVMTVMAEDRDSGNNGTVTYSLKQVPMKGNTPLFTIDRDLGLITTTMSNSLDREVKDMYDTVIVQAKDKGPNQRSASATVTIYIEDINDNAPQFTQKVYKTTMSENLPLEASVTSVSATDADIGVNAKLTYTLLEKDRTYFSMTSVKATNTGVLRVFKQPDFDTLPNPTFNLTVYVTDSDESHKDVAFIEVNITDYNDNPPVFVPNVQHVTIFENVSLTTSLARFRASDRDLGLNRQFTYEIERRTDPDRQYNVDGNGLVTVNSFLDREGNRGPSHRIHVLAVDKGTPSQTGTGTLMVTLLDVNDNPPRFAEDYRPVVYENDPAGRIVVNISAVDSDTLANGPPFDFRLPCGGQCPCPENPTCDAFDFTFRREGGQKSYGLGIVRSLRVFDREKQKEYHMPIIMTDSGKPPMTGTNTLTIIIGDINDNIHSPGHKNVFVYNYKGAFENVYLGTVYAEDLDDWDIKDKTFTFLDGPTSLFRLEADTGALYTKGKIRGGEYTLTVEVADSHWGNQVPCTVTVTVQEIGDDAVFNSGSVRFTDITAEEFTDRPKTGTGTSDYGHSKYDLFRAKLAEKLNIPVGNVDIFTVMNHPTLPRTIDVRFAAHNSPYYKPARLDGIVSQSMEEFSTDLGLKIAMVPIDECLKEDCESGGCSNELITSGDPLVINTNGTSLIGVTAYIVAECTCAARDFSSDKTSCDRPNACLNGGTCVQQEMNYKCECLHGFAGPRCQQTHHSFRGHGWAWYEPLAQCEDSHTSVEFMTNRASGVIFYNGPIRALSSDEAEDYIILELKHGYPQLRINHGSGEARLTMDGRNSFGAKELNYLNDGTWHRVDIIRKGKDVKMIVDQCRSSIIEENENAQVSSEDRRHCESTGTTPGPNKYINVNTPLQLGGIANHMLDYPQNLPKHSFAGCIKNLRHDGKLYDLHIGKVGNHKHSQDGCLDEDEKCGENDLSGPVCGMNGNCMANLNDKEVQCRCKPGWRGPMCSIPTTTKDFGVDSFIEWELKDHFFEHKVDNLRHQTDLQLMFRTRQQGGMLFIVQNAHKSEYLILEIANMHLQFRYNLGSGEQQLSLPFVNVSDGYWHTATLERVGQWVTLVLDSGEGRNYNSTLGQQDKHLEVRISQAGVFSGGDVRFSASSSVVLVDDDYRKSCMNDIRYNGEWFPMDTSQSTESDAAEVQRSANLDDVCESTACVGMYCIPPLVCLDLWRHAECRCPLGQEFVGGHEMCRNIDECASSPCVQGHCMDTPTGFYCECYDGYYGELCHLAQLKSAFVDLSMGAILAIIICAIVLILVILLFIMYSRRRRPDSYVTGVDPDDDVRENIIHYDEEGVGEEDQDAYDINRLKKPMQESPPVRKSIPPPVAVKPNKKAPPAHTGPPPPIKDYIKNRQHETDNDPNAPPHDSVREYAYEGGGSDAGSLSSLASTTDVDDQDFDYLSNWGPRFNKLANMYGGPPQPPRRR